MSIQFCNKRGDFDVKLTNPKMQGKRKFGKVFVSFRQKEETSEEDFKLFKEAPQEFKSLDIGEESKLSLEHVKRLIQRNSTRIL